MDIPEVMIANPNGTRRVVVTKPLPGNHWLELLMEADCRVEIAQGDNILPKNHILALVGNRCDGVIGQLTETWDAEMLAALKQAGGKIYSNYAVGTNNIDLAAATALGLPVGNTPGVLTEATAEIAVALTFAASRRIVEADRFMRAGLFHGWLPTLFLGGLFHGKTVGVVGAGRIGTAYARMMVEGHKMNLVYFNRRPNPDIEDFVRSYANFLRARGERPVSCRRAESINELLQAADVVSLHVPLDSGSRHLIDDARLAMMKPDAILVNTSRGPVVDEEALVRHCMTHPEFRAALDVFEDEPAMKPGLDGLGNVVVVPHIASATKWTREGMASLAACNLIAMLEGYPVSPTGDIHPYLSGVPPKSAPSIVNAGVLGLSAKN